MFKILTIRRPHYACVTAANEVFIQRVAECFVVLLLYISIYESMLFLCVIFIFCSRRKLYIPLFKRLLSPGCSEVGVVAGVVAEVGKKGEKEEAEAEAVEEKEAEEEEAAVYKFITIINNLVILNKKLY